MLLIYVEKTTSRLKYAFNLVLRDIIQTAFEITTDLEKFTEHEGPKFSYHVHSLGEEFYIQSNPLLFENGIVEQEIVPFTHEGTTAFFGTSNRSNFTFDILTSFFIKYIYKRVIITNRAVP